MNKKIKIIDLLNKISNGEEVPKRIKYKGVELTYYDGAINYYRKDSKELFEMLYGGSQLNDEIEILEDNTEEIEEKSNFEDMGYEIAQAYFEFYKGIAKALTEKRKEKNNE